MYAIFSMLGALLGVAFFRKKHAALAPQCLSAWCLMPL